MVECLFGLDILDLGRKTVRKVDFSQRLQNSFQNFFQDWSQKYFSFFSNKHPVWTECLDGPGLVFGPGCLYKFLHQRMDEYGDCIYMVL